MGGQQDDGGCTGKLSKPSQHLDAVHAWHFQIQKYQIVRLLGGHVQRFLPIDRRIHVQINRLERFSQREANVLLVVHDKDGLAAHCKFLL